MRTLNYSEKCILYTSLTNNILKREETRLNNLICICIPVYYPDVVVSVQIPIKLFIFYSHS